MTKLEDDKIETAKEKKEREKAAGQAALVRLRNQLVAFMKEHDSGNIVGRLVDSGELKRLSSFMYTADHTGINLISIHHYGGYPPVHVNEENAHTQDIMFLNHYKVFTVKK